MICPRCQTPITDGPQQIIGRGGRSKAKVVACARCRSAFAAHHAFASRRDELIAQHGAWFRIA